MKSKKNATCPIVSLLTILSKRHMLVIIYTLKKDPMRFNDLQESLSINTSTLSTRLRELVEISLVEIHVCTKDSRQHYYTLTKRGHKMSAALRVLAKI